MKLENKAALVTGASRGIGRAIALALAAEGSRVAVNFTQNAQEAEAVVKLIQGMGRDAFAIKTDIRKLDEVRSMIQQVKDRFGGLDILVNNAGILRDNYLTFLKEEDWDEVLEVNLKGAFFCIKTAAREMMRQKSGRIINISSDAGLLGDLMRANYASAKAGLNGLTRTAARELAASGITVNAVSPGVIETDMIQNMSETRRQKQHDSIPMTRFGQPDEVAKAVVFLASGDAAYITGEVLCVDGGLHTR